MNVDIVKAAYFTPMGGGRWGAPMLFESGGGLGKSGVIESVARAWGEPCLVLSPAERGEGQFGVVPVPVVVDGVTFLDFPVPLEFVRVLGQGGMLFLDELGWAPRALQPSLMGCIHARRLGAYTFHPRVRVIGATNPASTTGMDIPSTTANRLGIMPWLAPTVEQHRDYMISGGGAGIAGGNASAEETRVIALWADAWAKAVGLETAFLSSFPEWKNIEPGTLDATGNVIPGDPSKGWPSDRSWENATRARASAAVHGLSLANTDLFVASFIGDAAGEQWATFVEHQDIPSPSDVLDGKVKFAHDGARLDMTHGVLGSCVAFLAAPGAQVTTDRTNALWRLFDSVGDEALDVVAPFGIQAIKAKIMKGDQKLIQKVNARLNPTVMLLG